MALQISAKQWLKEFYSRSDATACFKRHQNHVLDKVRVTRFTPPPPSDRVHKPLISSFALIKTKYGGGVELKNLGKFIEIAKYGGGGEPENLGKFIEIAKYGGEGSRKTWENLSNQ